MMKTKLLTGILVFLLLFAFTACGESGTGQTSGSSKSSGSSAKSNTAGSETGEESLQPGESAASSDEENQNNSNNTGSGVNTSTGGSGNNNTASGNKNSSVSGNKNSTPGNTGNVSSQASQQTYAFGTYQERLQQYHNPNGRLMSMAHRGDWKNYPENSLAGINSAIAKGVDIIEIDIQRTKDGKFILMHDATLNRTTNATVAGVRPPGVVSYNVSDWTLAQIKTLKLREGKGGATAKITDYPVCTSEEAISACKGKVIINLDKAWTHRFEFAPVLHSLGGFEFCAFKSASLATEVNKFLEDCDKKYGSRPLYNMLANGNVTNAIKTIRSFTLSKTKYPQMSEMAFGTGSAWEQGFDEAILSELEGKIGKGANTLTPERDNLTYWKRLKEAGYNSIQTDDIDGLVAYINSLYK